MPDFFGHAKVEGRENSKISLHDPDDFTVRAGTTPIIRFLLYITIVLEFWSILYDYFTFTYGRD